jgi:hypothetical protein
LMPLTLFIDIDYAIIDIIIDIDYWLLTLLLLLIIHYYDAINITHYNINSHITTDIITIALRHCHSSHFTYIIDYISLYLIFPHFHYYWHYYAIINATLHYYITHYLLRFWHFHYFEPAITPHYWHYAIIDIFTLIHYYHYYAIIFHYYSHYITLYYYELRH